MSGASTLKFFGRIQCTEQDYWVAQGVLKEAEEGVKNDMQEPRGKGINSTVYWVSHDLRKDWIQLPDCQPEQIVAARLLKKMLTGNLNAEIFGFPGKERNLLRAQLARIQHTTNIVPKGIYEMDEETAALKYAEEQPELTSETLKSLENWCSLDPIILKVGRCTHTEPLHIAEEERDAYKEKLAEDDKTEEALKAINEQTPIGTNPAWTVKTVGDT